jgi:hypothetical protein
MQVTPLQLVEAAEARWQVSGGEEDPAARHLTGDHWQGTSHLSSSDSPLILTARNLTRHPRRQATDPTVNAMPITCWEEAKAAARQLQRRGFPDRPPPSYLYGVPASMHACIHAFIRLAC